MSKVEDSIKPHVSLILSGTIMIVDPSSGSKNSQPGYALFKAAELTDSGFIKIEYKNTLAHRLYHLSKSLREDFERPDILVTENIPPVMIGKGFFNKSMLSLQKSIGVVISCYDCPLIEVAPISWRQNIPNNYLKTDENDSIVMGLTVLKIAHRIAGRPWAGISDELLGKLTTGEWVKQ